MMASGRSLSIAAKELSNSSLLLILMGVIAVPVASPPSWICSRKGLEKGSVALARAVTRRADGSMSRINWTLLPASSAVTLAMPVTFPPGRERLMTRPVAIGSPVSAITIGISCVACFAATAVGVNQVTMTSTLKRTSSAASSGSRLICPSADRNSNRMFCPSIYPRSRSPCRNSRQNSSGANNQRADGRHLWLVLRTRHERPRHGHAAERDYELSSSDVDGHATLPRGSCPLQVERYHALARGRMIFFCAAKT